MSACHSARAAAQSRAASGPDAMTAAPVRSRSAKGRSAVLATTVPLVGEAEAVDRSARARSAVLGTVDPGGSERSSTRLAPSKPTTAPATVPAGVIGARPPTTSRRVKVAIVPPPANSANRSSRPVPDSDSAAARRRQATECSISGTGARWRPNWRATTAKSARSAPPPRGSGRAIPAPPMAASEDHSRGSKPVGAAARTVSMGDSAAKKAPKAPSMASWSVEYQVRTPGSRSANEGILDR